MEYDRTDAGEEEKVARCAIERQGEFGQLFLDYIGCPRGSKGRMCVPLEVEVLAMPTIIDVDGGEWIPVNADALKELVIEYRQLKQKMLEGQADTGEECG